MFLILLLTTVTILLISNQYRKTKKLPPGPFPFPFIGNVPQIALKIWKSGGLVQMLTEYRKEFGSVFTLWLGPIPHVNITDYETSYEVFVKNGNKYADKHLPPIFEAFRDNNGILFTNGESWQELRRFSMHTMRNMGMGRDLMEEKILAELNARCAELDERAENGIVVEPVEHFFDLTVGSIINSLLMGFRFDERTKARFFHFKHLLEEGRDKFGPFDMTMPVWVLKYLFPQRYSFFFDVQQEILDYVSEDAVKRLHDFNDGKYEINSDNTEDYIDAFICKIQQNPGSKIYNEHNLKVAVLDLWITGQETTTTTLISAFIQLLHNPEVMDRAREELIRVTNGRDLSLKDKNSTPYLNATIAEIQRFASILNVNFWRVNHEPTTIGGHPVDSGAVLCTQLSALHSNEEIFKNPEQFQPERYLNDEDLLQQVIPFGVGKRSCLGEGLAKAELYLIIGNLLLRYDFEAEDGLLPSRTEALPWSAARVPQKYKMVFKKRI